MIAIATDASVVAAIETRCRTLQAAFVRIAQTRMADVPVLNARLQVQAVGFERVGDDTQWAMGILVTPWFMNLLRLPLFESAAAPALAVGVKAERDCGTQRIEFIGAHETAVGAFEAASLFSPMFEFADQAAAVATAREVLKCLRPELPTSSTPATPATPQLQPAAPAVPARRGFLFGRSAAAAAQ